MPRSLTHRVACAVFITGALLLLREESNTDTNTNTTNTTTNWAVWVALRKHPPSLRIFRSLLEWNILLWGTVASLKLWYRYIGEDVVAELLFASSSSGGGHMDVVDNKNNADDGAYYNNNGGGGDGGGTAEARKRVYVQVQQQDEDASEVLFSDPHASFSEVMTGTLEELPTIRPYSDALTISDISDNTAVTPDQSTVDNQQQIQQQQQQQQQQHAGVETEEESESQTCSSFDAQEISQAPSVHSVAGAALDMLLPILVALFFFTLLSTEKMVRMDPRWPRLAHVMPLLLVAFLTTTQLIRPWKARKHFMIVVGWTMGAPLFSVTFRDGFIGDIFTSTVRPLQDAAFTVCYILSGFQGYWSDGYEGFWDSVNHNPQHLNDDDDAVAAAALPTEAPFAHSVLPPLETSWFLHTVLLPMCMVSPLWWRFLQNLRQTHDNRRRWPYLGNAFKYLLAAEVAMFGVFDPSKQKTVVWLGSFVVATLYQVWWDIFMDWELLVPNENRPHSGLGSWLCRYRLRKNRLYPSKAFYAAILVINFTLRFCWTLSFLPPRYLNQAGVLSDTFQHSDWSRALAPAIASAEIIRRTMWGWIRLEAEAIKVKGEQEQPLMSPAAIYELQYRGEKPEEAYGDVLDGMEPMGVGYEEFGPRLKRWTFSSREGIVPALIEKLKTLEHASQFHVLAELSVWATIFAMLGLVAAAHRMTL